MEQELNNVTANELISSAPLATNPCYVQPFFRLSNQDCLDGMKYIKSESINCILTDPPYKYLKNQKLEIDFNEIAFFEEAKRVLKKDGFIVIFGRGESFYRWNNILLNLNFKFKEDIVWDKSYTSSPVLPISRIHENVAIWTKVNGIINKVKIPYLEAKRNDYQSIINDVKRLKSALNNEKSLELLLNYLESDLRNDRTYTRNVSKFHTTMQTERLGKQEVNTMQAIKNGMQEKSIIKEIREHYNPIHPTQKPVRLLERLLNLTTQEKDLVLDSFTGSCSTGQACINLNREFIGFEIDKEYYDLSVKRISENNKQHLMF